MTNNALNETEMAPHDATIPGFSEYEEPSINFREVIQKLILGRRHVALLSLVALAISSAVAFLVPPEYTSKASFIPPTSTNTSAAAALMGQLSQLSGLGSAGLMGGTKNPADVYVGILKSRSIADEIISRFGLKSVYRVKKVSQAEKALSKHSDFDVGLKDSIVTISVTDKDPNRARELANAYLDALRKANGRLALTESSQRRLFFERQLANEKDELENAEVELEKTEEQSGLIAPAGQTATEIQMVARTRAEIADREVQLSALRQFATPENPELVRLKSEISDLQGQLRRLHVNNSKNNGAIPTSKVPELELEYVRKLREVKYHETLFEILSRQYEAARLDEAHEAPVLQVLDSASAPDSRSSPNRGLIMGGGLIFGFVIGSVWVLKGKDIRRFYSTLMFSDPRTEISAVRSATKE